MPDLEEDHGPFREYAEAYADVEIAREAMTSAARRSKGKYVPEQVFEDLVVFYQTCCKRFVEATEALHEHQSSS